MSLLYFHDVPLIKRALFNNVSQCKVEYQYSPPPLPLFKGLSFCRALYYTLRDLPARLYLSRRAAAPLPERNTPLCQPQRELEFGSLAT